MGQRSKLHIRPLQKKYDDDNADFASCDIIHNNAQKRGTVDMLSELEWFVHKVCAGAIGCKKITLLSGCKQKVFRFAPQVIHITPEIFHISNYQCVYVRAMLEEKNCSKTFTHDIHVDVLPYIVRNKTLYFFTIFLVIKVEMIEISPVHHILEFSV